MSIALLALASEAVQLHVPARNAQLGDLGIDALGVLAGVLLWRIGRRARVRWRAHQRGRRQIV